MWHRPEWWVWLVAAISWLILIGNSVAGYVSPTSGAHDHHHMHSEPGLGSQILAGSIHWELMVLAMMLPIIIPSVKGVALRSLWRRRHRGVAGFLIGYMLPWTLIGILVCSILALASGLDLKWQAAVTAAVFVLAAVWQFSKYKKRAMTLCHRTMPLAPRGLKADRDCIKYGWRIGFSCCVNCLVLMIACTLAAHHPVALAVCGYLGYSEKYSWKPSPRLASAGILGLAVLFGSTPFIR